MKHLYYIVVVKLISAFCAELTLIHRTAHALPTVLSL